MKRKKYQALLVASVNLIERGIIQPEDGDHYDELVEAIAEEIRIQDPHWDELVNSLSFLETCVERLTDSLLVPQSDARKLRSVAESFLENPILKHLRESY